MTTLTSATSTDTLSKLIREGIETGKYPVGSKLPGENALAKTYNVSRITVRTALQQLRASGYIYTRMGVGSFIAENNTPLMIAELSQRILPQGTMSQSMEFRRVIDEACINDAIEFATDDEIDHLVEIGDRYFSLLVNFNSTNEASVSALIDADFDIHFEICKLSKNPLFVMAYLAAQTTIKEYLRAMLLFRAIVFARLSDTPGEKDLHKPLIKAIQARDKTQAIKISRQLVDFEFVPTDLERVHFPSSIDSASL